MECVHRPRRGVQRERVVDGIPLRIEDKHRHVGALSERCQQLLFDAMGTDVRTAPARNARSDRGIRDAQTGAGALGRDGGRTLSSACNALRVDSQIIQVVVHVAGKLATTAVVPDDAR